MSASRPIIRSAATRLASSHTSCTAQRYSHPLLASSSSSLLSVQSASLSSHVGPNTTSTMSHRSDPLDPHFLLSRHSLNSLSRIESRGSVLDLYRKICRLLPQVLKAYELQGEDSYHRALRNLRFFFENHRELQDSNVIEVLRHKAEMEIEEAMLMYKTKSHVAALCFGEPQLASVARHAKQQRDQPQVGSGQQGKEAAGGQQLPSSFMQDFLAGTA